MDEDHNDGHINSPRNSVGGLVDQQRAREGSISQTVTFFYSTLKKKERLIARCMAELDKKKEQKSWLMVVQGNGSDYYLLHFCGFKVIFV